jgi:CRP/FNR family transcriptional regulator, anaerobic regulatory protein
VEKMNEIFDLLFKKVNEKVSLTEAEQEICKSFFIYKKIRKRQYLLQEGEVCKYTAFVVKGNLRLYTVNEKGAEHVLQFALEGWIIADLYSFITGEPSSYNIDALEDTEVLLLSKSAQEEMVQLVPAIQQYYYLLIQNAYVALQRRMTIAISQTADEKYNNLLANYPEIIQRVPQHMIASYLGFKPETLSRIRRKNL